jgi:predicted Zn-dependent peptidase
MMFKGSPKHPDITRQFGDRGMQFNGTTSLDRTNYYEVFQATQDNLDWALRMEADRMTHSNIAKKDLDSEMTVVRNEYENGENSPGSVLQKRMQSVAYDWHSYGRATIGNKSDIENVKISNLQAFYHQYYQPDNAVLLVAGKFDPAATLRSISTLFGASSGPSNPRRTASARSPCGARATCRSSCSATRCRPACIRTAMRSASPPPSWATRRRAACTSCSSTAARRARCSRSR